MSFQKGDFVVATKSGAGDKVSGYGRVSYEQGDELEITVVYPDRLNVRSLSGGNVFRISLDRVRPVPRMVGELPEGGMPPEDPRIQWIFEDAGRMADRLGLCRDYDRLCDAIGIPGRVRNFTITIISESGLKVSAEVAARSKRLAEQIVRERFAAPAQSRTLQLEATRGAEA